MKRRRPSPRRLDAIAREVATLYRPRLTRASRSSTRVRICCAWWRETMRRAVERGVLRQEHADQLTQGMAF